MRAPSGSISFGIGLVRGAAWLAAAVLATACGNSEQPSTATAPSDRLAPGRLSTLSPGRNWFEAYCTECHGEAGKGDGPGGALTKPPPADLTKIAARHGRFDADEVAAFIDGRRDVEAHGSREMPVWGHRETQRKEPAMEEEQYLTPEKIRELVAYLETLQVP